MLNERKDEEERRQRAALKLRNQINLGYIIDDGTGGFSRARRQRKTINYNFEDYDKQIRAAVRVSNKRETSPSPQPEAPPAAMYGGRSTRRRGMLDASAFAGALQRQTSTASYFHLPDQ